MSQATLLGILGLKTSTGAFVFPAAVDALNKPTLMSFPVLLSPSMPAVAAGAAAVIASDKVAIVETIGGKVRGYIREGIFTYKGIPYGEVGAHDRFQPARKAEPWTGVRISMQYGRVCPRGPRGNVGRR